MCILSVHARRRIAGGVMRCVQYARTRSYLVHSHISPDCRAFTDPPLCRSLAMSRRKHDIQFLLNRGEDAPIAPPLPQPVPTLAPLAPPSSLVDSIALPKLAPPAPRFYPAAQRGAATYYRSPLWTLGPQGSIVEPLFSTRRKLADPKTSALDPELSKRRYHCNYLDCGCRFKQRGGTCNSRATQRHRDALVLTWLTTAYVQTLRSTFALYITTSENSSVTSAIRVSVSVGMYLPTTLYWSLVAHLRILTLEFRRSIAFWPSLGSSISSRVRFEISYHAIRANLSETNMNNGAFTMRRTSTSTLCQYIRSCDHLAAGCAHLPTPRQTHYGGTSAAISVALY